MAEKLKALIIGPGNIGTDLLMKAQRSDWIEPVWMVGVEHSEGIQRAQGMGVKTSITGVDGVLEHIAADDIRIAFDATSAYAHAEHARKLSQKAAYCENQPTQGLVSRRFANNDVVK